MSTKRKPGRLPPWARKYIDDPDSPFATAAGDIHDFLESLRILDGWYWYDHLPPPANLEAAIDDLKLAVKAAARKRIG